ncbi:hypothetical protein L1987_30899 [Smallanthus sonchifolius]|uniref:Uncharacterized protein n=1 Tax=Smallanthus sonchifolius TaxID=185202 RepID=A0ACB9I5D8_9ASTR|nr:hypothetical protein L1987_30899 [Smallanthus sonchifolius]
MVTTATNRRCLHHRHVSFRSSGRINTTTSFDWFRNVKVLHSFYYNPKVNRYPHDSTLTRGCNIAIKISREADPRVEPLFPTPILPSIALIPRSLAPIPSIRPPNGDTAKKPNSDEYGDDSGPEYEISEESRLFREKQEKAKQDFLMKQRAAALAVPTNDKAVRSRLRRLGEPVTLFGEREMERRDRLRMIMAKLDSEGQLERLMKVLEEEEAAVNAVAMEDGGGEEEGGAIEYPFYTEGSMALLKAR